ncbi:hypothetical protein [Acinetobacter indicus]|uniref:hypothetical protein n=1 Tax=Acinetobacter indicus TaxID=756892 RepID=UPI002574B400|nr:hypothetical protein [Acinetobacter indicus]MDM1330226.1 hypothetical protein [Acinetobacter indicus]MDM1337481.1 hypothetical protein [Acinetobacter indicus]
MADIQLKPEERLAQLIKSGVSLVGHTDFAKIMGCKANTVRVWATRGNGPIKPVIVNDMYKWRLTDIRNLVGA